MKLVENWHKKWSVWLLAVATSLAGMEQFLPHLQQVLPANWYQYAFVLILAARMIQQAGQDD
jgi:hypothetical protein